MSPDLRQVLAELGRVDRLLVALDFDGTISRIVAVPSAARPVPGALECLARLSGAPGTQVVLVSGRARHDLATVSGAGDIATLIGSHGQEIGADLTLSGAETALLDDVRARVAAAVGGTPGVRVEAKPAGLAVHVRGCTDRDAELALDVVRGLADELAGTFCLEGKLVIELSTRTIVRPVHLSTRGFTDDPAAFDGALHLVEDNLRRALAEDEVDPHRLSQVIRRTIGKWVSDTYRRRPMIIPTVLEV